MRFRKIDMSIPIFLASNNTYAPFCATTMLSFLLHTNEKLDFFILESDFSEESKKKLYLLCERYEHCVLEFISVDVTRLFPDFVIGDYSLDMYSRFLIPELKPQVSRALYVDVDVIMTGDVKALFQTDLQGFMVAAVPWCWDDAREKMKLGSSEKHRIFHSGLLLIDCDQWRERHVTEALLSKAVECKNILEWADQDVLNMYFNSNYASLPQKYCVIPCWLDRMKQSGEEALNATKSPVLIHYATGWRGKPWNNPELPYASDFWRVASQTEFYMDIVKILFQSVIREYEPHLDRCRTKNKKAKRQIVYLYLLVILLLICCCMLAVDIF